MRVVGVALVRNEADIIEAFVRTNLVLLDANPLDDIRNTHKIAAVIVNGRYLSRADLDKMLAGVEKAAGRK